MRYFPVFMDVDRARIVVVGGGEAAAQKLRLLVKTTAAIRVVAQAPNAAVRALVRDCGGELIEARFSPNHLAGARLVFAASDDADERAVVAAAAWTLGAPVNAVDLPAISSFTMPAIVDRDPFVVAIGSEGDAPMLVRELRAQIEAWLPASLGRTARAAGRLRQQVRARIADPDARRRFWRDLLGGPWRQAVEHDDAGADAAFAAALDCVSQGAAPAGRVIIVGAGPGDPDLLTLKALQALQEADVIVIDGLVTDAILDRARRDARRLHVGKQGYGVATDQRLINRILIAEASKGQVVVRLKGGDPFVFGRAAEELAALQAAGIQAEVIPGVTAALACAAGIGLPLTRREDIRQFSLVTGATTDGLPDLDWTALARPGHAFAIYMGVRAAGLFAERLIAAGAARTLPVVIVENGARADERAIATTLTDLAAAIVSKTIHGPAIIYVGLDWASAGLAQPARVETYVGPAKASNATPGADFAYATYWTAG